MRLDDRLSKMEADRPHAGEFFLRMYQRIHMRLPAHLKERYDELLALEEDDPYRAEMNEASNRITEPIAPGMIEWSRQIDAIRLPPLESTPWESLAWRRVTIPRPPSIPAHAVDYLLASVDRLDGPERDAHLVAAMILAAAEVSA